MSFQLSSEYTLKGDQESAVEQLVRSLQAGNRHQTLLGVTGSGKTFTAANVVTALDRPTLVISHNKTLAAQLYSEFKQFFPQNAVEYFVSYFDYYQPEAYIPRTDTYIEKDSSINEEIERLRLSATSSLLSRQDVIVVASVSWFESQNKFLEAQRIKMRTEFDLEMMQEMGFCSGIENYSRHLSGRAPGSRPYTLLDFFPRDFLLVVDESHATIPQIGGMYEGDRSRKLTLVEYGFRLPSALDNRPLNFPEFMEMTGQILYISATPAEFEIRNSVVGNENYIPHSRTRIGQEETEPVLLPMLTGRASAQLDVHKPGTHLIAQQIIRPTGLLDPRITVRSLKHQIDETIEYCRQRVEKGERILITTLTKRTAEDLTDYLRDVGLKVRYLHSEIDAIERVEILRSLRAGEFDVLVGINLLREGLDLPEVSLVCILDADKEGFLRSQTSLIQTAGRAARHVNGEVVLFADTMTESIQRLIAITEYRRGKQMEYNEANGVTPTSVRRAVQESLHTILRGRDLEQSIVRETGADLDLTEVLRELEAEMQTAAANLEYERAALLRDQINELKNGTGLSKIEPKNRRPVSYRSSKTPKKGRAKHH